MELSTFLTCPPNSLDEDTAKLLASAWHVQHVTKERNIVLQGVANSIETIVLEGRLTSSISGPHGRTVCVGFHAGPCVVTPAVARTRDGNSLVSLVANTDALIAQMESAALTELMLNSEPIREWANEILQHELARKAEREWCLAALGGADRLAWFRKMHPHHEELFSHSNIASFLGVTPVTLSRLRGAERDNAFN